MSDLIERLRHADEYSQQRMHGSRIFGEAADEIDRLRSALEGATHIANTAGARIRELEADWQAALRRLDPALECYRRLKGLGMRHHNPGHTYYCCGGMTHTPDCPVAALDAQPPVSQETPERQSCTECAERGRYREALSSIVEDYEHIAAYTPDVSRDAAYYETAKAAIAGSPCDSYVIDSYEGTDCGRCGEATHGGSGVERQRP